MGKKPDRIIEIDKNGNSKLVDPKKNINKIKAKNKLSFEHINKIIEISRVKGKDAVKEYLKNLK